MLRRARFGLPLLLLAGCAIESPRPPLPRAFPSDAPGPSPEVVSTRTATESGGYLDWCHAADLIAFERATRNASEIYTIRPDGRDERCISCENEELAEGRRLKGKKNRGKAFRGAPAWHPSCEFLVIQVGGEHFGLTSWERPPFGIHNDLWLLAADGSWAERIHAVDRLGGAMAPRFSDTGERLLWTARQSTGVRVGQSLLHRSPGAENPWAGWYLMLADFARPSGGPGALSNELALYRDEGGFFTTTAITGDTLWFSHTERQQGLVDEIFRARVGGGERENLSGSPGTWEEQGEPSPWGTLVTYRSSLPYGWSRPPHPIGTLRLELWALTARGERVQLTRLNTGADRRRRALVRDYAWGPGGREIAIFSTVYTWGKAPRESIEILRLNGAF